MESREPSETSFLSDAFQCAFAEGTATVLFQPAPRKSIERMRGKILKYTKGCSQAAHARGEVAHDQHFDSGEGKDRARLAMGWPASARIMDPVQASIVCEGASQMLQVKQWELSCGLDVGLLIVLLC